MHRRSMLPGYHAMDPETFWRAHATFTWEIFRPVELFRLVPGALNRRSLLELQRRVGAATRSRRYQPAA